ncbi:MAG: hypothetical protein KAI47_18365 [Deltaproteobacteria bacterium]|nr:hypothetical protein [Deltaproteobacteria bacterium]
MVTMRIPDHWTPEQALAVIETLDALAQEFWSTYGQAIARDLYSPPSDPFESYRQLELPLTRFPPAAELPF